MPIIRSGPTFSYAECEDGTELLWDGKEVYVSGGSLKKLLERPIDIAEHIVVLRQALTLALSEPQEADKEFRAVPGFVYVITAGSSAAAGTGRLHAKIGITSDLKQRIRGLQSSCPLPLQFFYYFYSKNCLRDEFDLHKRFEAQRLHGEWFNLTLANLESIRADYS